MRFLRFIKLIHLLSWRGLTSGRQLIYLASLSLAVACFSLTLGLNTSLNLGLAQEQAKAAASELTVSSSQLNLAAVAEFAAQQGFKASQQINLNNLLASQNNFVLSQLLAVDEDYPLMGELEVSYPQPRQITSGPAAEEIWLESNLAARLEAKLGDLIEVGPLQLKFTQEVLASPQAGQQLISLAPKAWVRLASLQNTYLLGEHARFTNQLNLLSPLTAQGELAQPSYLNQQAEVLSQFIEQQQLEAEVKLSKNTNNFFYKALSQLEEFLKLLNLINLLLACLAAVLASFGQLKQLSSNYALLTSLGVNKTAALLVQLGQLAWLASLAAVLGLAGGSLALEVLAANLHAYLGFNLAQLAGSFYVTGVISWLFSLALALSLAATPLAKLTKITTWEALQGKSASLKPWGWLSFSLTLALLLVSANFLTANWWVNLISLALLALGLSLITLLAWLVLKALRPWLGYLPWSLNKALARLVNHPTSSLVQLGCFTLVLTLLVLTGKLSGQLLTSWQSSSLASKPNVFALDIPPNKTQELSQVLAEHNLAASSFYPLTRARLTHINSQPAKEVLSAKAQQDNSLHRELNLTWASHLPANNQLLAGSWWPENSQQAYISVEEGLAKRLGLQLGDTLGFNLAGQLLEAEILNFRKVDWLDMQPNFFVIFSPASLSNTSANYLASFNLPQENTPLLTQLYRAFPTTSFIDLRQITQQLSQLLSQLGYLLKLQLGITLLAGLLVSLALLQTSQKNRQAENFLLSVFGATSRQLKQRLTYEFAALGLLAGILANLLAEVSYALLVKLVIDVEWQAQVALWLSLPLAAALLLSLLARLSFKQG